MSDEWMKRMAAHSAMTHFIDFMVQEGDHTKCVAVKIKDSQTIIYDGDEEITDLIRPFKTLQEACFYDFAKDMAGDSLKKD